MTFLPYWIMRILFSHDSEKQDRGRSSNLVYNTRIHTNYELILFVITVDLACSASINGEAVGKQNKNCRNKWKEHIPPSPRHPSIPALLFPHPCFTPTTQDRSI